MSLFLHHGGSISCRDLQGRCPLHVSIEHHRVKVSKLLVEHILNLTDANLHSVGLTQLHKYVIEGTIDKLRNTLMSKNDMVACWVDSEDSVGWTLLHYAAWRGDLAIFKLLEEAGVSLRSKSSSINALHIASASGSSSVVRHLTKLLLNERDDSKRTALHYAARSNSTKTVQLLIDAGLPVNNLDIVERSPLYYACREGSASVSSLLLRSVAIPHGKEREDMRCRVSGDGLSGVLVILLDLLGDGHVDEAPKIKIALNRPLTSAIKARKVECVHILLIHGADPNAANSNGGNALHHAARSGSPNITRLLPNRIRDCGVQNCKGETARNIALEKRFFCIARLLGEDDSDIDGCHCICSGKYEENHESIMLKTLLYQQG